MKKIMLFLISIIALQVQASKIIEKIQVHFDSDVYDLNISEKENLLKAIDRYSPSSENFFIEIIGHTDTDGDLKYNQQLSEKRAAFIADILKQKNFKPNQIIEKGVAFTKPIAENNDEEGKHQNRRVEILIYDNQPVKINQLGKHTLQTERIKIHAQRDTLVEFNCGIKAFIPKNTFTSSNGKTIEGIVELELTPYNDFKDFILGDAPMSFLNGGDDYFISAGMFNLDVYQLDKELSLAENAFIDFDIPATSLEEKMVLFEFSNTENDWQQLENQLERKVALIEKTAKRHKGVYDFKPECVYGRFKAHDISDSIFLNKVVDNFESQFIPSDIYKLSQKNLYLNRLNENLQALNRKLNTFELEYQVKKYENKLGEKCISFLIGKSKNQSFNESKYLDVFYLRVDEFPKTNSFSKINSVLYDGKEITIELISQTGNETISVKPENIHNKKFSKKALKTLAEDVEKTFAQRIKMIESYESKISHLEHKIAEFETDLELYTASLSNQIVEQKAFLEKVCLLHKRYERKSNEDVFRKSFLNLEEFEKWVVKHYENQKILKTELVNINNLIKCSDFDYAKENYRVEEYEYTYMTTPLEASLSDVRYSFRTQNLGMFNVDRMMKMEENFVVQVEKYVNERNEVLPITNLYVVNEDMNGVIEYYVNKRMQYNLYNFPIQGENNALIAVDIHGNTYQLKKEDFRKALKNKDYKSQIQLSTIQENETLAMF